MIGPYCELSVIVTHLRCKSVVCQITTCSGYVDCMFIFCFTISCCLWRSRNGGRTPTSNNFQVLTMPSTPMRLWDLCSSQRERVWLCTVTWTTRYTFHTQVHIVTSDRSDTTCIEYTQWRLQRIKVPFRHVVQKMEEYQELLRQLEPMSQEESDDFSEDTFQLILYFE